MRNRILDISDVVVIEDFHRGSRDEVFARAILEEAPTTAEQLFRNADMYINVVKRAHDLVEPSQPAPQKKGIHCRTSVGIRGLEMMSMPRGHRRCEREALPMTTRGCWMKSLMACVPTIRRCTTPYVTTVTSRIQSATTDHSSRFLRH
jgi:hypothetical protein